MEVEGKPVSGMKINERCGYIKMRAETFPEEVLLAAIIRVTATGGKVIVKEPGKRKRTTFTIEK